jgi:dTDP-4-dehydrorhamnose reductase
MRTETWLVTGASGQLGGHVLRRLLAERPPPRVFALAGARAIGAAVETLRIDLRDSDRVRHAVRSRRPTHVVHTAALTSVAEAAARPDDARRTNVDGTQAIVAAAAECGAALVYTSTDMVFDGWHAPYGEEAAVNPQTIYARTKAAAETLLAGYERAVVARIPLLYGFPFTARPNTFVNQIAALRAGQSLSLFTDEFRTPLWVVDAAAALIAIARSALCATRGGRSAFNGVLHIAGPERLSRYEMVARFAAVLGVVHPALTPVSRCTAGGTEPRPADLSLSGDRFARIFPELAPRPIGPHVFAAESLRTAYPASALPHGT